jgi:sugar lactone lactonase YvrE
VFHLLVFSALASAEDFTIQTFAGGGLPQNIQGTSAVLEGPGGIAMDANGNAYFTLGGLNIVLKLDTNGVLTLVAGNGTPGFSGDGGPATGAQLYQPSGIALDAAGDVFIQDYGNARIRMVRNGVITTVAGGGYYTADNILAVDTQLSSTTFTADAAGNLYVEDPGPGYSATPTCCRIRKVTNGTITTIAGTGMYGPSGDGGPAISAQLAGPGAMAVDAAGTLYFSDAGQGFGNIRKIQNGVITTVVPGVAPTLLALDQSGNLFIGYGEAIQEISNGVTTTIAGMPNAVYGITSIGDNGPAIDAILNGLSGLSVDKADNIFIAQEVFGGETMPLPVIGGLIRKISNGIITTVAGDGTGARPSIGDGGPPVDAQLFSPNSVTMDAAGNVYIAESNRIRESSQGVITTIVGTGVAGFGGDGGPAIDALLSGPTGIGLDAAGNLYIADRGNGRVRMVSTNGIITTIAGPGTFGYNGDGGPATGEQLSYLTGIAVSPGGDVYVSNADAVHPAVWKISNGIINMVAGGGLNYNDPGPALSAQLAGPAGIAMDQAGNLYIADSFSGRIREVSNGTITTIAGSGVPITSSGDGGPATSSNLQNPSAVAVDSLGRVYIGESARVRRIANGIINTVAGNGRSNFGTLSGNGPSGYSGDGGAATSAMVTPASLAIGPNGQVYEVEAQPSRVRVLTPVPTPGLSFSASPAPIPLNAGSTEGQTTLAWSTSGYPSLEIFANGSLFDRAGPSGSVPTGNWVNNGMNFFLVDPATGAPISTVTVHTTPSTTTSQVAFTANPSPITLAAGASVGVTTLSWNAAGHSGLQIWVDGVLFDGGLPASGSVTTGNWVSDGTSFALMDSGQTIATLIVHTTSASGPVTFTASPNPITLAAGTAVGVTTLSWNSPGDSGLQIFVHGTDLFASGLPASGSIVTGNWVSAGTVFTLINPATGQTIAGVTVGTQ